MRGGLDLETGDVVERKVRRRRSEDGARIGLAPKRSWVAKRDWACHVTHVLLRKRLLGNVGSRSTFWGSVPAAHA